MQRFTRLVIPDAFATLVSVQPLGSEALKRTYKTASGKVAHGLIYRHDEPRLGIFEPGRS